LAWVRRLALIRALVCEKVPIRVSILVHHADQGVEQVLDHRDQLGVGLVTLLIGFQQRQLLVEIDGGQVGQTGRGRVVRRRRALALVGASSIIVAAVETKLEA
jgi:hypothetical protein